MLSRAFTKPKKSPKHGDNESKSGTSMLDSEDCLVGFMDDRPLFFCGESVSRLSLRETLRASVGVMGESPLGMTEKVVLLRGKVYALKRFRALRVRRREFGKRIERLAQVSKRCEYLVPVIAYLYTKRIKFVVSDYFPMGSLADLLAGEFTNTFTIYSAILYTYIYSLFLLKLFFQ
jgi:serine/threonine protein kinase